MVSKHASVIHVTVSIGLSCAAVIAIMNAWAEYQVSHLVKLRNSAEERNGSQIDYSSLLAAKGYTPTARSALMVGSLLARAAHNASGEQASIYAESARAYLEQAEAQRPDWAQVTLTKLYALRNQESLQGAENPAYLLRLSYLQSPYLAKEGAWRIGQVIKHWNETDDTTRTAAASEAVYLASLSRSDRVHIRLIVSNTQLEPLFNKISKENY